jgi:uncharacterized protein YcbK (DUF882 family)
VKLVVAILLISTTAFADALPSSKKDRELAAKQAAKHGSPPAIGTKPRPLINLYNEWTNEWLAVDPRALPAAATIDRFLRDHYTNKPTTMDPKLIGILLGAAASFHSDTVHIVSGFRHPKFNLILRKKGHQVARDSQHTHGNAIDFFIPHIPTIQLHAWAKNQKLGGVGLYLGSAFVHMDTGPIRYWSGD